MSNLGVVSDLTFSDAKPGLANKNNQYFAIENL